MSEDEVKQILEQYLQHNDWNTQIAWGRNQGIDIDAFKDNERWIIEVKGCGYLLAIRVNYFLSVLGETLQRMNSPKDKYSIAFPYIKQFINLWNRLPLLAKERTGITALFVKSNGEVIEL